MPVNTEFLELFRDEARGRLDHIVATLSAIRDGRTAADDLDALFRHIHSIKGAAGMVGLPEIGAVASVMEDALAGARADGALPPELIDPLMHATDALRRLVEGEGESTDARIAAITAAQILAAAPAPGEHG